jgi:prevent-host-death family protein
MLQIVNITDARNNLAKLIEKVKTTQKPIVIVQDSTPSVVIYPYEELAKKEEETEQLFQLRFNEVFAEGEIAFKNYLKKNNLPTPSSEEEAYSIIKNA